MLLKENQIRNIIKNILKEEEGLEALKQKAKDKRMDSYVGKIGDIFNYKRILKKKDFNKGFFFGMPNKGGNFSDKGNVKYENEGGTDTVKIKIALAYIWPFLPETTKITSIGRLQKNQDAIIVQYGKREGIDVHGIGLTKTRNKLKDKGYKIGRYVGQGHGGLKNTIAFDISPKRKPTNSDLEKLAKTIKIFNELYGNDLFKFRDFRKGGSLIEYGESQRIVHVVVEFDTMKVDEYDPVYFTKIIETLPDNEREAIEDDFKDSNIFLGKPSEASKTKA